MKQLLSIALCIVMCSLSSMAQHNRSRRDFTLPADSTYNVSIASNIEKATISARIAMSKNDERHGMSKHYWTLFWNKESDSKYNYVTFQCGNTNYGDYIDQRFARITVGRHINGNDSIIFTKDLQGGLNRSTGFNSVLLEYCNDRELNIFVGHKEYQLLCSCSAPLISCSDCGITGNVNLNIQSFVTKNFIDKSIELTSSWTLQTLKEYFAKTTDVYEGFWTYLDRDNDVKKAKCGGRYTFALVKNANGYDIIYISGAETNSTKWKCGIIKGQLRNTIFNNHYDLIWHDAMFETISTDAHADIIDNVILSLQFPLYDTTIRFSKM